MIINKINNFSHWCFSDKEDKSWKATWYVTSREDIGDFYVVVRELGSSKSTIEKDLVYNARSYKIQDLPVSRSKYELCVLARDSEGNVKHFRESQCQILNEQTYSSTAHLRSSFSLIMIVLFFRILLWNSFGDKFFRYTNLKKLFVKKILRSYYIHTYLFM